MKNLFLLIAFSASLFLELKAQEKPLTRVNQTNNNVRPITQGSLITAPTADLKAKSNCCDANPYTLTACSQSLFQSFKNLTAGAGIRNCHPTLNFPSVSFAMPENCFSFQTTSTSMVTFTSFYMPKSNLFRVIWGGAPGNFSYYGACAPEPIIFPHPGVIENHVFEAKLIRQSDYRAFTSSTRTYASMSAVPAISPSEILQIIAVYLEEHGDYLSTHETSDYNNTASSKGIVVKVKLRNGTIVLCYVINNYDGAGTLTWKEKNPACLK